MNELICVAKRCEAQEQVFFGVEKRWQAQPCIFYNALWRWGNPMSPLSAFYNLPWRVDEDVHHLATRSAASCLDNWLGSKLPRITRLHRSEALGSPIH